MSCRFKRPRMPLPPAVALICIQESRGPCGRDRALLACGHSPLPDWNPTDMDDHGPYLTRRLRYQPTVVRGPRSRLGGRICS